MDYSLVHNGSVSVRFTTDVLILVVMDYSLVLECAGFHHSCEHDVLILVVMDYSLVRGGSVNDGGQCGRLNPCCNGL